MIKRRIVLIRLAQLDCPIYVLDDKEKDSSILYKVCIKKWAALITHTILLGNILGCKRMKYESNTTLSS